MENILENLLELQQKITLMKINGYSNKETFVLLEIPASTYYKEMRRIRAIIDKVIG